MTRTADWDLTPYFSAPGAADYIAFRDALAADLLSLGQTAAELSPATAGEQPAWVRFLVAYEDLSARLGHLSSYLSCQSAADSENEFIAAECGRMAELKAAREQILVRVRAGLATTTDDDFAALCAASELDGAAHFLTRIRQRAKMSMDPTLESLAADLSVDGFSAWSRLYDRITGNLSFEFAPKGEEPKTLPVAMVRSLLEDPDPEVRRAAFAGSSAAWESAAEPIAACLNAISGTRLTLYSRRGIGDFLTPALVDAAIDRKTLDAMHSAVRARQSIGREYLELKAEALSLPKLQFCDLLAPLQSSEERVDWDHAKGRVTSAFADSYPALAQYANHALDNRWIDYNPRPGKRPGGFCTSSRVLGESRIFMTFNGSAGDVQTLAHELGHGFHNWLMRDMRGFSRSYPMTLAETASTFAEQIVIDAALDSADTPAAERLSLLDHRLIEGAVFTLNIPMRFDFEVALYEARKSGEVTVTQLKEMMETAQRDNFGDALDPDGLDPWYWASKLHFYITEVSFYNFPYTFGYLFSLGLFARAKAEGSDFLSTYERLLRATGSAPAEQVASSVLGVDLSEPAFWDASLELIEQDLVAYRAALAERKGS